MKYEHILLIAVVALAILSEAMGAVPDMTRTQEALDSLD